MIKLFRTFHPLSVLPLFAVAILLQAFRWNVSNHELAVSAVQTFCKHLLIHPDVAQTLSFTQSKLIGCLVLFVQAVLFNKVVNDHNLLGKPSFLPALLFVVCTSFADTLGGLSPVLIVNFLLIWLLNQFLICYRKPDARSLIFDMGFMIALATIIYPPMFLFLLIVWVGLLIFRSFNWREWAMSLLGFATVAFFLGFYYYWNGVLWSVGSEWVQVKNDAPFRALPRLVLFIAFAIGLLALVQLRTNFFRSVVHIRKSFQLLTALLAAVILTANAGFGVQINHYVLASVPVAVLLAYYFMHATKPWVYESLFAALLGTILYFQLF